MPSETPTPLTPTRLAEIGGISVPFASQVLKGTVKKWPRTLALKVWAETGEKFGPIEGVADDDLHVLARLEGIAA